MLNRVILYEDKFSFKPFNISTQKQNQNSDYDEKEEKFKNMLKSFKVSITKEIKIKSSNN